MNDFSPVENECSSDKEVKRPSRTAGPFFHPRLCVFSSLFYSSHRYSLIPVKPIQASVNTDSLIP